MALIKVAPTRVTEVFIAEEPIGALTTVCLSSPGKKIRAGSSTTQQWVAGATIAGGASGGPVRVVTHGVVSGIVCGALVSAGDRVASFTSGKITPLNTITPDISGSISAISGFITNVAASITAISGYITDVAASITAISGYITVVSGSLNILSGALSASLGMVGNSIATISGMFSGVGLVITQPGFQSGAGVLAINTQPQFQSGRGSLSIDTQPGFQSGRGLVALTAQSFNTARVLGRALDNGGVGSGIRVLVALGG